MQTWLVFKRAYSKLPAALLCKVDHDLIYQFRLTRRRVPGDDGQLTLDDRVQFIKVWIARGYAATHSLLINFIKLIVKMRGIVQTRNGPWANAADALLDSLLPLLDQDIIDVLAAVRILHAPALIFSYPARYLLCHGLAGAVSVSRDYHTAGAINLYLRIPKELKFGVFCRVNFPIDHLHHRAIRHRDRTFKSTLNKTEGIHLALANEKTRVMSNVVYVEERCW